MRRTGGGLHAGRCEPVTIGSVRGGAVAQLLSGAPLFVKSVGWRRTKHIFSKRITCARRLGGLRPQQANAVRGASVNGASVPVPRTFHRTSSAWDTGTPSLGAGPGTGALVPIARDTSAVYHARLRPPDLATHMLAAAGQRACAAAPAAPRVVLRRVVTPLAARRVVGRRARVVQPPAALQPGVTALIAGVVATLASQVRRFPLSRFRAFMRCERGAALLRAHVVPRLIRGHVARRRAPQLSW